MDCGGLLRNLPNQKKTNGKSGLSLLRFDGLGLVGLDGDEVMCYGTLRSWPLMGGPMADRESWATPPLREGREREREFFKPQAKGLLFYLFPFLF